MTDLNPTIAHDWTPKGSAYLAVVAPAALATEAAPGRSARYCYLPTFQIVNALEQEGWGLIAATSPRPRIKTGSHGKHVVVLQRREDPVSAEHLQMGKLVGANDSVIRLSLVNSHDGSSAVSLRLGFFRFVCSNTTVSEGRSLFARSILHNKVTIDAVIAAARELAAIQPVLARQLQAMTRHELTADGARAFATFARRLRWDDDQPGPSPDELLAVRRPDDCGRSVWTVLNCVQENVIRGGAQYETKTKDGRPLRLTSRPIKAVREDLRINGALLARAGELVAA